MIVTKEYGLFPIIFASPVVIVYFGLLINAGFRYCSNPKKSWLNEIHLWMWKTDLHFSKIKAKAWKNMQGFQRRSYSDWRID